MTTNRSLLQSALGVSLSLAVGSSSAAAQVRIIDEGTFLITRRGGPSETEGFRIRVDNGLVLATGQLTSGNRRVSSALTTDSLGVPVDYKLDVRENGASTMSIAAVGRSGRLTARAQLPRGEESTREYPVSVGSVILEDDDLVHQTYFLLLPKKTTMQAINPRTSRGGAATLRAVGAESVTIGGKPVAGTHYSVTVGGRAREFWVDASGRVLQVEIPSIGLKAVRDEPPR